MLFANGSQINFVVPADLTEGTAELAVRSGNAVSAGVPSQVVSLARHLLRYVNLN